MNNHDHQPTIIVAVTFRDFNGSVNDRIQRRFLESLTGQSYKNWKIVVTQFRERNVQPELEKLNLPLVFRRADIPDENKFSLTDVLLNAIEESRQTAGNSIILWTTCDVIYEQNFFAQMVANYSPRCALVCHPHVTYRTLEELGSGTHASAPLKSGMDLIAMDSKALTDPKILSAIKDYRFMDWGVFEHFFVGLAMLAGGDRINLVNCTTVQKVENDRKPGKETNAWLDKVWKKNKPVFDKFLQEHHLPTRLWHLGFCHFRFRKTNPSLSFYLRRIPNMASYLNFLRKS